MTTTTDYGTWKNTVDGSSLTVEQTVEESFGTEGTEGYDIDMIVLEYRTEINQALPMGVALCGDQFYGPCYEGDQEFEGYPLNEYGDLDIKSIVDKIDLWEIIKRNEEGSDEDDAPSGE